MFLKYFAFAEEPFGVAPDPRFLYLGTEHREALASLIYGTQSNRGFLALIAKPGMGKTSLLHRYLERMNTTARTAFIFRTDCESQEFIRHVLLNLSIDATGKDLPAMHDALNQSLTEEKRAGRRFVLVIDEAQNLSEDVLESVRQLSNCGAPGTTLMQIVISGQPALAEKLSRPSLSQLRQRISHVIRVSPLNRDEVNSYIDHRLSIAGCNNRELFTVGARSLIAEHSDGIPRQVNNICFNSLSLACALRRKTIDRAIVFEALADLDLESLIEQPAEVLTSRKEVSTHVNSDPPRRRRWRWTPIFAIAIALVLAIGAGFNYREIKASDTAKASDPVLRSSPSSVQKPSGAEDTNHLTGSGRRSLSVSPGQTLYRISIENLGRYDPQILEEIRALNPWLSDPNSIPAGQEIFLPSTPTSATGDHRLARDQSLSSMQEVEKQ